MITSASSQNTNAEPSHSDLALQKNTGSISAIFSFFVIAFAWSWLLGFYASYTIPIAPVSSTILNTASGFGPSIAALITIAFFGLVFPVGGPLSEEFGWRSYAQPALNAKMGWRTASLIIGIIWGLWYLPWFFTAGTAQSHMPFITFMLNIIAGSILFSWLFIKSIGSVIPVLIAHASLNAFAGIMSIIPTAETARPYTLVTGILVATACLILLRPYPHWMRGNLQC
jgi:uncharacterized protein